MYGGFYFVGWQKVPTGRKVTSLILLSNIHCMFRIIYNWLRTYLWRGGHRARQANIKRIFYRSWWAGVTNDSNQVGHFGAIRQKPVVLSLLRIWCKKSSKSRPWKRWWKQNLKKTPGRHPRHAWWSEKQVRFWIRVLYHQAGQQFLLWHGVLLCWVRLSCSCSRRVASSTECLLNGMIIRSPIAAKTANGKHKQEEAAA